MLFDHRRLWCMHRAGCRQIRVRVQMAGRAFDESAKKADSYDRLPHANFRDSRTARVCERGRACARAPCIPTVTGLICLTGCIILSIRMLVITV